MFAGDDVHGVALIVNLKINPIITASANATKKTHRTVLFSMRKWPDSSSGLGFLFTHWTSLHGECDVMRARLRYPKPRSLVLTHCNIDLEHLESQCTNRVSRG
jgi:hypothetical protein